MYVCMLERRLLYREIDIRFCVSFFHFLIKQTTLLENMKSPPPPPTSVFVSFRVVSNVLSLPPSYLLYLLYLGRSVHRTFFSLEEEGVTMLYIEI